VVGRISHLGMLYPDHVYSAYVYSPERAISQGDEGSVTATASLRSRLLSVLIGHDLSDSQADSAGSIPVTRSMVKPPVRALLPRPGPASHGPSVPSGPLARWDQRTSRAVLVIVALGLFGQRRRGLG